MKDEWWRINQLKINKAPQSVIKYPNGFKIERYLLSEEEIKTPFDPTIDTGIHFR